MSDPYTPPFSTMSPPAPSVQVPNAVLMKRRIVGGLLAGGAAWGILATVWQLSSGRVANAVTLAIRLPLLWVLPFVLAGVAGASLWRGKRPGMALAAIVLGLQLIAFRINDFSYEFNTAANVYLGVTLQTGPTGKINGVQFLSLGAGSRFTALHYAQHRIGYFRINLVALACLIVLLSLRAATNGTAVKQPATPETGTGAPAPVA